MNERKKQIAKAEKHLQKAMRLLLSDDNIHIISDIISFELAAIPPSKNSRCKLDFSITTQKDEGLEDGYYSM